MRKDRSHITRLSLVALAMTLCWPAAAGRRAATDADRPALGVVSFRNVNGGTDAIAGVMGPVRRVLDRRGFRIVGNGRIEEFLRRHRIRARDALSGQAVGELAAAVGARYLLVGSIDAWSMNGGPEVGLASRMLDSETGEIVWAGSVSFHATEVPGLLAMGRPKTLEAAAERAVEELFDSLVLRRGRGDVRAMKPQRRSRRSLLTETPVFYRAFSLTKRPDLRVALLPLSNRSSHPEAPMVVGDHLLTLLLGSGVPVVDPGELRRALIEGDIQPLYGVTLDQMRSLGRTLGVEAVLDGTILRYENHDSPVPRIDLFVRLREAQTGKVLWSATTSRDGDQTRTFYNAGRIRGMDRLAESAVADLLSTWIR